MPRLDFGETNSITILGDSYGSGDFDIYIGFRIIAVIRSILVVEPYETYFVPCLTFLRTFYRSAVHKGWWTVDGSRQPNEAPPDP